LLHSPNVIENKAQSSTLKNTKLPYWQEVGEGIKYRGTYSQLANEMLEIRLVNRGGLAAQNQLSVPRNVSLQGVLNSQLETQLQIHKTKLDRDSDF